MKTSLIVTKKEKIKVEKMMHECMKGKKLQITNAFEHKVAERLVDAKIAVVSKKKIMVKFQK